MSGRRRRLDFEFDLRDRGSKNLSDDDVLESSSIKIEKMADIVAQTGATIDSFETVLMKKETHEKDMVDVGVLCFPDADHPFFRVESCSSLLRNQISYIHQVVPHQASRVVIL